MPTLTLPARAGARYTLIVLGEQLTQPALKAIVYDDLPAATKSGPNTKAASESKFANVRVLNACTDCPYVDLAANSVDVFQKVGFAMRTSSLPFPGGSYRWRVLVSGDTLNQVTEPETYSVLAGHNYLLLVSGRTRDHSARLELIEEE